jgi:hypothetical protein
MMDLVLIDPSGTLPAARRAREETERSMEARRREQEGQERRERQERREGRLEPVEGEEYRYETMQAQRQDLIHWGPVWAGLMSTFGVLIVLGLIGMAAGLTTVTLTGAVSMAAIIWASIITLVAFFVGGWVAGRTSSFRGTRASALIMGSMVWALGMVFATLMAAIGVGGIAGAALGIFGLPSGISPAAISTAQGYALGALITIVLAYILAVLGAMVGVNALAERRAER